MRKYDDEFKREAVRKIHDGQSVASFARELGVAESLLHKWKREAMEANSDAEREVIALRKKLREVEMERDILKKQPLSSAAAGSYIPVINAEKARYPLMALCRVMRVSSSAYHAYRRGKSYVVSAKKAALGEQVKAIFYRHWRRYGARRIAAELKAAGLSMGKYLVRSPMRRLGLNAIRPRRYVPQTTDSQHTVPPSPYLLLDEANTPQKPREVVVGDITYLPLQAGKWGYLASWQDKFSKRIVC